MDHGGKRGPTCPKTPIWPSHWIRRNSRKQYGWWVVIGPTKRIQIVAHTGPRCAQNIPKMLFYSAPHGQLAEFQHGFAEERKEEEKEKGTCGDPRQAVPQPLNPSYAIEYMHIQCVRSVRSFFCNIFYETPAILMKFGTYVPGKNCCKTVQTFFTSPQRCIYATL